MSATVVVYRVLAPFNIIRKVGVSITPRIISFSFSSSAMDYGDG